MTALTSPPTLNGSSISEPVTTPPETEKKYKMIAENVTISYGDFPAVKDITMKFPEKSVTALIGPSGCGKTTFLRCLNRMHDMTKNAKVEGKVMIDEIDLFRKSFLKC